ncbi:MAG: glycosyltransferase family 4 protein [Opitutaceae bacterium]|jgi:glycosyltransferase involved in cell wall biosynthesis
MNGSPAIRGKRLAVVLSHPTQYYSPWFRWVRAHTPIELRVFYLWDFGASSQRDPNFGTTFKWDVDLLSGYDSEFLANSSRSPGTDHFLGLNNPGLAGRIAEWHPDALLLFGYKWASHLRAAAWARFHRIPILFRGDSHLLGRGSPAPHVRLALRLLYSQFACFLCVGAANRDYFEAFGVPDRKLFRAPHSVDGALFDKDRPDHKEGAAKLRSELGLDPATRVVMFAGKFVAAKQPLELLRSFIELRLPDTAIIFVGDGPEKEALKELAGHQTGKPDGARVHFLPFANQSEMPSRYLLADLFVLPSRGHYETWGLAINEAMHMGVPCLVSDRVGCQKDLVTRGETGWVFDPTDPPSLGRTLSAALAELGNASRRDEILEAISRRMQGYTYEKTTLGLIAALESLRP